MHCKRTTRCSDQLCACSDHVRMVSGQLLSELESATATLQKFESRRQTVTAVPGAALGLKYE